MAGKLDWQKMLGLKGSNFDIRSLKKYTSPHAADDLNKFLEKMPVHAGQTMLMIAAITWMAAGAAGLYATVQLQKLTELKAELEEAVAGQPKVPTIQETGIASTDVQKFADNMEDIYPGIRVSSNGSSITLSAGSTASFGQWREAIGHVHNGGSTWKVRTENMCVGRECGREPLSITLKINKISVNAPQS